MKSCFKKIILSLVAILSIYFTTAQSIKKRQVKRIEKILSSDDMQGRRTFTPGIEKASAFIEAEFKKTGLQTFNGAANYRQDFSMTAATTNSTKVIVDGKQIKDSLIANFSYLPQV